MNLDKLHAAVKKLDNLLSDRHQGLITWNFMLKDALQEIVSMCFKAGIKA